MPKVLDRMERQLLETARRQVESLGYAKTTIRSVAAECGIAVGTVYNYFPSKEMLVATFVAEDWLSCTGPLSEQSFADSKARIQAVYDAVRSFCESHRTLFSDSEAKSAYHAAVSGRHGMLRAQLAELILPACGDGDDNTFLSEFIAEALLTWTTEGKPFEELYPVIEKLTGNEREES